LVLSFLAAGAGFAALGSRTGRAGSGISQALADEPAVRQRLAAGRFCSGGPGVTGDVPQPRPGGTASFRAGDTGAILAAFAGVLPDTLLKDDRIASTPSSVDPYDAMNLVNVRYRAAAPPSPGWRSRTALFPQQIGFELRGGATVDRVGFRHTSAAPPDTWAKEVALLVSTDGPDSGFYNVLRRMLAQTTDSQEFIFFETPARYVRVCIYSNYGSSDYVSLGNLALAVTPPPGVGPLFPPPARGTGGSR
jgi:hypothetical protein